MRHCVKLPTDLFFCTHNQHHFISSHSRDHASFSHSSNTQSVLIYTRYRSGSSFVGELFNSHPDIYYIFEFTKFLHHNNENRTVYLSSSLVESCLADATSCWFKHWTDDIPDINNYIAPYWRDRSLCNKLDNYHACAPLSTEALECYCRRFKYRVIKEISLSSLHLFHNMWDSDNWKVIHLVRDPRGVISSRIKIAEQKHPELKGTFTSGDLGKLYVRQAHTYCKEIMVDKMYYMDHKTRIYRKYKRIRYEEIAQQPITEAQSLYNFIGIPFHDDVAKSISQSTVEDSSVKFDPFSTRRNSNTTAANWLQHLPLDFILRIQEVCIKVMTELNYRIIRENDHYKEFTVSDIT